MRFIKLPSGNFINLEAFSNVSCYNINSITGAYLILHKIFSDIEIRYEKDDARYILQYLEFIRQDTSFEGFHFE
jgi:hypothetical protein